MLACHQPRPRCVASHAIAHDVNSGSPKSPATSRVSPRASGHVNAMVRAAYTSVAAHAETWIRDWGLGIGSDSGFRFFLIPNPQSQIPDGSTTERAESARRDPQPALR